MHFDEKVQQSVLKRHCLQNNSEDALVEFLSKAGVYTCEQRVWNYDLNVQHDPSRRTFIKMYYSTKRRAGKINLVALRILLDRFLLEPPIPHLGNSDGVDIDSVFMTAPHGHVYFYKTNAVLTQILPLPQHELAQHWPLFFRNQMPYHQLHLAARSDPLTYLNSYNRLLDVQNGSGNDEMLNIITKYNLEPAILTMARIDRSYLTVFGAFVYALFGSRSGWDKFNLLNSFVFV